jgi:hypothetical protein
MLPQTTLRWIAPSVQQCVNVCATLTFGVAMVIAARPVQAEPAPATKPNPKPARPYMAQVVGLQWLNPLEHKDYATE